ncbi:MAG TPA: complex I subunit 1 family protein [Tepidisphaeraceae bacterium]|nr:complex I subunit 1 family protein [Tepidisphaeraceae bacterium]
MVDLIQRIPPWVYIAIIAHGVVLGTVAYLILLERKIASWVQDRIGPNRVGLGFGLIPWLKDKHMFGLGQPLADGLKFILKEDYRPKNTDRVLFTMAPGMMIIVIIISIAVIPWGGWKGDRATITVPAGMTPAAAIESALPPHHELISVDNAAAVPQLLDPHVAVPTARNVAYVHGWAFQIANLNVGVLFILAVLSLAVYGIVIGAWASNNKYSFLGGLRATANMISYEIPLGLAVLVVVAMFGTLDLAVIVEKQVHYWGGFWPAWNVFAQPLAFLMFLICIHAEANRAPFDTAEAEQELVGGYHTEYSSMRFALFFLAEYAGMITTSAVCVCLFFGGYHLPWIDLIPAVASLQPDPANPSVTTSLLWCLIRAFVLFGKTLLIIGVFMWVRWSLPRFRFDQIMDLAWRALIPIALGQFFMTAVVLWLFMGTERAFMRLPGRIALALLVGNVVLLAVTMLVSTLIPAGPDTNRKIKIANSRFARTPLPAGAA